MQIEGAEEYRISSTPSIDTVQYGNLVHTGNVHMTCIREMLIWLWCGGTNFEVLRS
jgi:hypothetical protein